LSVENEKDFSKITPKNRKNSAGKNPGADPEERPLAAEG
jgi:hypothetical protein